MQNIIETRYAIVDNSEYEMRVIKLPNGIEVQVYHKGKPAAQFASEFADWDNIHDLAKYHKIDALEDIIYSVKSRIKEYHTRQPMVI